MFKQEYVKIHLGYVGFGHAAIIFGANQDMQQNIQKQENRVPYVLEHIIYFKCRIIIYENLGGGMFYAKSIC